MPTGRSQKEKGTKEMRAGQVIRECVRFSLHGPLSSSRLLVDLLFGGIGSLALLDSNKAAQPSQRLVANNKGRGDGSLALGHDTLLLELLKLGSVDLEDVLLALESFLVREQDQSTGIVVKVISGLLDDGEALFDAVQGLVAKGVGLLDIG
jgi:hypothetical protein